MTVDEIAARLTRLKPVVCEAHLAFRRDGSSYHVPEESGGPQLDYDTARKIEKLMQSGSTITESDWALAGEPPLELVGYKHDRWHRLWRRLEKV